MRGRKASLLSALLAATAIAPVAMSQTTIIQSNSGIGCSTVCINGNCTSTCDDSDNAGVMKGDGNVISKNREFKDFVGVVSTDIDTTVTQGETFSVTVKADSNLQEQIEVKLEGGDLRIRLKNGQYQDATLSVQVVMPDLKRLTQVGSASLEFAGFDQANLELNVQGAGSIKGRDNVVTNLLLNTQGAAVLDLMDSELTNAEVHVAGTAEVRLNFQRSVGQISGDVAGVSEIHYCGNPQNVVNVFGVADIRRIDCG